MAFKAYITNAGREVLTTISTGSKTLVYSKARLGKQHCEDSEVAVGLTALQEAFNKTGIDNNTSILNAVYSNGSARVTVYFNAKGITSAITIKEIGLFVKNPSGSGEDILFCYIASETSTGGDKVEPGAQFARTYEISMGVTGASSVTVSASMDNYQSKITANGLLRGDGNGNITADTNTYSVSGHKHSASDITSGELPISHGGTGASSVEGAKTKLGIPTIYYQEEAPETVTPGAIWLQPVSN